MIDKLDCAVIGGGVVGLAIARAMAMKGREVVVLEAADAIGTGTSSRNSEVIHAGIYYPEGSLKGRLCVAGKHQLYQYLESHGIDHNRCGKYVVATDAAEEAALETVVAKAAANGCDDLEWVDGAEAMRNEPGLKCTKALWSPSTGIFDTHGYMLALQGDLEDRGGMVAFLSPMVAGTVTPDGIVIRSGGEAEMEVLCSTVINSAGLGAQSVARSVEGLASHSIPEGYICKGNYFQLTGRAPFERLIYPVPGPASLGCHYTRDLGGQGRFGPDVEWIDELNYEVDANRAESFYHSIRKYWPDLPDDSLQPGYSGIRPKLQAPGEPAEDFMIQGPAEHGVSGLINLYGIESPGLTSSLAIGDHVAEMI